MVETGYRRGETTASLPWPHGAISGGKRLAAKNWVPEPGALAIWLEPRHSYAPRRAAPARQPIICKLEESGFVPCKSPSNAPLC
jgi:hypothetical protein